VKKNQSKPPARKQNIVRVPKKEQLGPQDIKEQRPPNPRPKPGGSKGSKNE